MWRNMEPAPVVQGQAEYDGEDHEASAECEPFAPAHAPPGTGAAPRTMQPTAIEADRGKKQHTNGDLPAAVGRIAVSLPCARAGPTGVSARRAHGMSAPRGAGSPKGSL